MWTDYTDIFGAPFLIDICMLIGFELDLNVKL